MTERVSVARWVVRGLLLFTLTFADLNDIWSPDTVANTLFAWTLIRESDVDYDEFATLYGPDGVPRHIAGQPGIPRDTYFFRPCGEASLRAQETFVLRPVPPTESGASPRGLGPRPPDPGERVCSIFPPGISLLALPVLAPFVLAGVSPADGGMLVRAGHLAAALIETIAVLLLWSVMRRFTSARWALALVFLYWLGTSVRTISAQALWQHAGVHLALALALWLVLQERVSIRRELIAGLVMGAGVSVRQTTAIIALGVARLPWPRVAVVRPLAPILFALGVALGVVPLLVYNALAFGSPFEQGYGDKPFYPQTLEPGLRGLLISPSRGILIYEPWIVAGLAAFGLAWRRPGLVALRLRGLSVAWLLLLVTYANYMEWWGGRVFGPRFLDDLMPALVVAIAWGISQGLLSRTWARVMFWVAAGWSLLLFNVAALVYDPNGWDTVPVNVNFDPSKLFLWSDPQWLNVLASLGSADARVLAGALLSALLLGLLLRLELRERPLRPS
ncbi:MAG: hypothetical protein HYU87_02785 [Chloroflexi bacterium]|nr:hypothetical protein [Chloroflexota bacterium]